MNDTDGGPAFPLTGMQHMHGQPVETVFVTGMTLRDYFAARLPHDEIQEIEYHNLSRDAQELLTGLKYPVVDPRQLKPGDMPPAEHCLEVIRFHASVNAALRYIAADAMLKERNK